MNMLRSLTALCLAGGIVSADDCLGNRCLTPEGGKCGFKVILYSRSASTGWSKIGVWFDSPGQTPERRYYTDTVDSQDSTHTASSPYSEYHFNRHMVWDKETGNLTDSVSYSGYFNGNHPHGYFLNCSFSDSDSCQHATYEFFLDNQLGYPNMFSDAGDHSMPLHEHYLYNGNGFNEDIKHYRSNEYTLSDLKKVSVKKMQVQWATYQAAPSSGASVPNVTPAMVEQSAPFSISAQRSITASEEGASLQEQEFGFLVSGGEKDKTYTINWQEEEENRSATTNVLISKGASNSDHMDVTAPGQGQSTWVGGKKLRVRGWPNPGNKRITYLRNLSVTSQN